MTFIWSDLHWNTLFILPHIFPTSSILHFTSPSISPSTATSDPKYLKRYLLKQLYVQRYTFISLPNILIHFITLLLLSITFNSLLLHTFPNSPKSCLDLSSKSVTSSVSFENSNRFQFHSLSLACTRLKLLSSILTFTSLTSAFIHLLGCFPSYRGIAKPRHQHTHTPPHTVHHIFVFRPLRGGRFNPHLTTL